MELLDQIQESFPTFTTRYFSAEWGGIDTNNPIGFYRTSRPVRKSGNFLKFQLSGNWTFSFPAIGLLTLLCLWILSYDNSLTIFSR